ncbi:hypothetical protein [Streptomyces sp. NPDC051921]|uniref:hypothetical protein n=1 Tax=Streptomyces sp. NPDC051921 TaxID=3155806 RepID=UPI00342AC490
MRLRFTRFRTATGILLAALGMAAGTLTIPSAAPAAADRGRVAHGAPRTAHPGDLSAARKAAGAHPGLDGPATGPEPAPPDRSPSSPAPTTPRPAPPSPDPGPRAGAHGGAQGGTTTRTGERLWLLGALGLALAATGAVAMAAARARGPR